MNWHFAKNNHDFYLGFQPGFAITKLRAEAFGFNGSDEGLNPMASFTAGYNFYFFKYFHFFVQNRIVFGTHTYDLPYGLNEYRFSAGLGFNINTKK